MGRVTVGNLRVPEGANCALADTRIQGNLKIERGAALQARSIRVEGIARTRAGDCRGGAQISFARASSPRYRE